MGNAPSGTVMLTPTGVRAGALTVQIGDNSALARALVGVSSAPLNLQARSPCTL